jgi:phage head maturation protease
MLLEGIRRGDYDALSFAFAPEDEEWKDNGDGTYDRTIRSIAFLDEISILSCAPAYEATEVKLRSLENFKEERQKEKEEHDKQILESLDAKLAEIESIKQEFGV